MTAKIQSDPWKIIQNNFDPKEERFYESIFSIGNGKMGQRANFEEDYSGDSMQGSYIAGLYYPDKTRVGWWKNGYPEYFAKVINSVNWIGIQVEINGNRLDLNDAEILSFYRELDMKNGVLLRHVDLRMRGGEELRITAERFCSLVRDELGCVRYQIKSLNQNIQLKVTPYLENKVVNEDSNYDEIFWDFLDSNVEADTAHVKAQTKKLFWITCAAFSQEQLMDGEIINTANDLQKSIHRVGIQNSLEIGVDQTYTMVKYCAVLSNLNYEPADMIDKARGLAKDAKQTGYNNLRSEHSAAWTLNWKNQDIQIDGDVDAQQAIRFNIFQLNQTYTGRDARLNIGPKGFTGEKYGGSTYWDTEAYCLPYYMSTAGDHVARNLLIYRHNHLQAAIDNAGKLGFTNGAALYPMVTMNGEECHNEWEITFEEIHRNGAMAYAIYDYIRYTGDWSYIASHGLEVLIAISRFWAQRVNFSEDKNKYVMLGVTGPNEYENNINNNWYTNYLAVWCMQFTSRMIDFCAEAYPEELSRIMDTTEFNATLELPDWNNKCDNMYFPEDEGRNIFLQQDGFLDKELRHRDTIPAHENPIWKHWSWDRILRSCFIKQADVLQGLFFFEDDFDQQIIARNYDFYEPMTVHESSLSPCIHSILAASLDRTEEAYKLYLRTARLDLDNMNDDTDDGCHITSMAGTWMSLVKGFGGFRIKDDSPYFRPQIPKNWDALNFRILFRDRVIKLSCTKENIELHVSGSPLHIYLYDKKYFIEDHFILKR